MMTPVGDAPSASAPAPQEASGSAGGGGNAPYGPPPPPKKLPEGLADDLLAAVDQGKLKASGAMLDDLTNWQQASAAKAERGLQHTQGAHVSARAAMRTVPAYDPKAAIVRLLDKVTHRGFDDYWKDVFFKMAKASGETKILVSDYLNVMRDAIGNNPYFTNEEARSMYELLKSEVHTSYGLKPTDTVRLPYSK